MSPVVVKEKFDPVEELDDPIFWAKVLQDWVQYFQRAMPMAIENLAIARCSRVVKIQHPKQNHIQIWDIQTQWR